MTVESILLGLIATLLATIALFLHGLASIGKGVDGALTTLTSNLGPGVVHKPKREFPVHRIFYLLAGIAGALSLYMGFR